MFVKICGVTRLADAHAAVEAGAQALGFVFWKPSPRFIDPYRARKIVATLPPFVTSVGVFVDQPADYVTGVAALVHLSAVQLHGAESPVFAAALARPVIKALATSDASTDRWPSGVTVLLDSCDPVKHGGTARTIDWDAARSIAARRRVLLAGGLTPHNVGAAISHVRPFGIDVSSGVEDAPGIKNHERIRALFEAVSRARESTLEREG